MSELALTDNQTDAIGGTSDAATGVTFPAYGATRWDRYINRAVEWMARVAGLANNLRPFEVDGNADAIGIRAGRVRLGNTTYAYAGADPAVDSLTNNDTTYVWGYITGGVFTISSAVDGTGWPAYPHWRLASVTMASGAITEIVDHRAELCSSVVIESGTAAARPAASTVGRLYWDTTNGRLNIDNGSAWKQADGSAA